MTAFSGKTQLETPS